MDYAALCRRAGLGCDFGDCHLALVRKMVQAYRQETRSLVTRDRIYSVGSIGADRAAGVGRNRCRARGGRFVAALCGGARQPDYAPIVARSTPFGGRLA